MPGADGKIRPEDNPKPWLPGQSGNPNGRPVKLFSHLAKEFKERGIERATASTVAEAYEYLLALPLSEIIDISGNPKLDNEYPAILRIAAKEMVGKRGIEILREMLDRAHGKAKQAIDHTSGGEAIQSSPLAGLPLDKQAEIIRMLNDGTKS